MTELIKPTEPVKTEEEYHELNMALASVLTTLKKHKNIMIKTAELQQWGQRKVEVTLVYRPSHQEWKAYDKAQSEYYVAKREQDLIAEAEQYNVTVEQLKEAKKRHELYNAKKCEKAPAHELGYFINIVTGVSVNEIQEQSQPQLSEA